MKKTRIEKGITLIALIITIIILLILAVVTIGSIQDSDIITYAQKAATDYEQKKTEEESKLSEYEGMIAGTLAGVGKATVGEKVQGNSTINGAPYSSTNPVIPAGFKAVNITTAGHESYWDAEDAPQVNNGLVIRDDDGNEFVWVPVANIDSFAKLQEGSTENYRAVLYDWNTDSTGNTPYSWSSSSTDYREPANLSSTYDDASKMSTWTETLYQDSFNKMVTSVAKYGGFYVGRYEISLNGDIAQSVPGVVPAINANNIGYNWYELYEKSRTYSKTNTNLGVVSEMIWGCQWDAMLKFILEGEQADHVSSSSEVSHNLGSPYFTGGTNYAGTIVYNDIASNIYDLEGNVFEFTQEARYDDVRVSRAGTYMSKVYDSSAHKSPSFRSKNGSPDAMPTYTRFTPYTLCNIMIEM